MRCLPLKFSNCVLRSTLSFGCDISICLGHATIRIERKYNRNSKEPIHLAAEWDQIWKILLNGIFSPIWSETRSERPIRHGVSKL